MASSAEWSAVPWNVRVAERLGHHAAKFLIASIGGAIALGVHPLPGLAGLLVPVSLFGFVILSWLMMRRHDRKLCEPCMAAMPLDAPRQAVRYRRRLWLAHALSEPRYLVPYLVVLFGSNLLQSGPGRYAWAAVQATMIYLILAQSTHRRLQPWCPVCSQGGGGEEVDETPPVLPQDDRQLI